MKPFIHAKSSAKKFGGKFEDYLEIHDFLDSSKSTIADNRHRALTHNSWFISVVIERIFGPTIKNSSGKLVSTREIAEQHVLEDFKMRFIPSAQDYLCEIEFKDWMDNGKGFPPGSAKLFNKKRKKMNTKELLEKKKLLEEKLKELREELSKDKGQVVLEVVRSVLEEYPDVGGVCWEQYTPYFNDGDYCIFSSNHDWAKIVSKDEYGDFVDEEEEHFSSNLDSKTLDEVREKLRKALNKFSSNDMFCFFGDHARVIVTREKLIVEEWDHE